MKIVKEKTMNKDSDNNQINGNGHKKGPPVPLIIMLLVIVGALGWHFLSKPKLPDDQVFVSGRIEGYETDVGAKIGGRIKTIKFREGELIEKDTLIAEITDDDIQARLKQAEAKHEAAVSVVEQREKNLETISWFIKQAKLQVSQSTEDFSAQIDQQEANLAQSSAELSQAKSQLIEAKAKEKLALKRKQRFEKLIGPGAVTKDEYDQAVTNYETAVATTQAKSSLVNANEKRVHIAQALLKKAKANRFTPSIRNTQLFATQRQLKEAEHQLNSAKAEVTASKAAIDEIKANIDYLHIKSPITGVVTARSVEPGEVVVTGQTLMSLIDLNELYLRGYVKESNIGKIRLGDKCKVYLDSFPDKPFDGKVIQIDPVASFTPENIYFKEDRVKQVFGIKIELENPGRFAKPGMPADAKIAVSEPGNE